jgi:DNA-binding winged helix-turn-helix (wHTH) protein
MTEPQAQIYEFGDFRMDSTKRLLCRRDGPAVALTAKAFDALLYLLEHRAVELKKEELMSAIWPGRVVEENNLNQIISTLRRTLGEAKGEHRYILTIPGRGYRFVAELHTDAMRTGSPAPTVAAIAVLPFMPLVAEHRPGTGYGGYPECASQWHSRTGRATHKLRAQIRNPRSEPPCRGPGTGG